MQRNRAFWQLCLWTCMSLLSLSSNLFAQDKTSSPYLVVISDDPETDRLPLKHTGANVRIAGTIADVQVTQVYQNTGERPLEAVYVFPASTRAAIYRMEMTIGDKIIRAQIQEKQQARQTYETAKSEGKTASLLEEHRPNVFQMNVANILPGDSLIVTFSYTELLVPDKATYEFVYPTVVGPRFTGQTGMKSGDDFTNPEQWTAQAYTSAGEAPTYGFSFDFSLNSAIPVASLSSGSHDMRFEGVGTNQATASLSADEINGGNRDLIVRYNLQGKEIRTGLLTYKKKGEKFFLLMAQPPERVKPKEIPPREYVFILDVSGSMSGFPLETSKKVMRRIIGKLRAQDRFNVMLFAGGSSTLAKKPLKANPLNKGRALAFIETANGGGGTQLYSAMQDAYQKLEPSGFSQNIVILTDGYISAEAGVFDLVRTNHPAVNVWAFGIGSSPNRHLIEGMAAVGGGEPFVVTGGNEADEKAEEFVEYISYPVLTDISVDFGQAKAYDIEPLRMPDMFAERPIIMHGKYRGRLRGEVTLKGVTGAGPYEQQIPLTDAEKNNEAIRYLWARERIRRISDHQGPIPPDSVQKEVTRLGLEYSLATVYTSFVAVYDEVRNEKGESETIQQPLPMPKGVPNSAVAISEVVTSGVPASYGSVQGGVVRIAGGSNTYAMQTIAITGVKSSAQYDACTGVVYSKQQLTSLSNRTVEGLSYLNGGGLDLNGLPLSQGLGSNDFPGMIPAFWTQNQGNYFGSKPLSYGTSSKSNAGYVQLWTPNSNEFGVNLEGDQYGQIGLQGRGAFKFGRLGYGSAYFDLGTNPVETDRNGDSFRDLPQSDRIGLGARIKLMPEVSLWGSNRSLVTTANVFYRKQSDQMGQIGSSEQGQPIYTAGRDFNHLSLQSSSYIQLWNRNSLGLNLALNRHQREQNWGDRLYNGQQTSFLGNLQYSHSMLDYKLFIDGGVSYRRENFNESLDQIDLQRTESVPGLYLIARAYPLSGLGISGGLRSDFHNLFGTFITPDLSIDWNWRGSSLVLAVGRSWHVANVFTENQRYLFSSREVVLEDALQPERSWDFNLALSQKLGGMTLGLNLGRVNYSNKVITNLDRSPDQIVFQNLDGEAHRSTLGLSMEMPLTSHISVEGSYLRDRSRSTYDGELRQDPFIPLHSGQAAIILRNRKQSPVNGWRLKAFASILGEQRIPDTDLLPIALQRRSSSPAVVLPNLKVTRFFKWGQIFVLGENLTDIRQLNPILAANDPFGEDFDAGLNWGPVLGRRISAGVSFSLNLDKTNQ